MSMFLRMYEVNSIKLVTVDLPLTKPCCKGEMTDFTNVTVNKNFEEFSKTGQNGNPPLIANVR
jgi:hypothetical protein